MRLCSVCGVELRPEKEVDHGDVDWVHPSEPQPHELREPWHPMVVEEYVRAAVEKAVDLATVKYEAMAERERAAHILAIERAKIEARLDEVCSAPFPFVLDTYWWRKREARTRELRAALDKVRS